MRAVIAASLVVALAGATPAVATPEEAVVRTRAWAEAASATIHPGIMTTRDSGSCTANFVFTDAAGAVYLGEAAHCSMAQAETDVNGCASKVHPIGGKVGLGGSGVVGTIAYNGWARMQERTEYDKFACANNDFALIRIPADALAKVNPSVPVFGGPTGIVDKAPEFGAKVFSYGNSNLRGGLAPLSPQRGFAVGTGGDGWYHLVYEFPTGVPGDSGAGFLDGSGRALGTLIDFNDVPPGSNGVGDMARMLDYARKHSGIKGLRLELGTEAFTG